MDKEDFLISPLKNEDVLLGAPWFDHLGASMKFHERQITFSLKVKKMELNVIALGHTIPLVNTLSFYKSMKSYISLYMIFVYDLCQRM